MRRVFKENGLSIVMFSLFLLFLIGQAVTGFNTYNQDQQDHHQAVIGFGQYLCSPHFMEAVAENWESEFLQMGLYVALTAFLFQKGSAESRDPDEKPEDPEADRGRPDAPWAVRKDGPMRKLYEHSLSAALLSLFLLSFIAHAYGSWRTFNQDQAAHGQAAVTMVHYLGSSRLWFESFQNWQSEFLAVFTLSVLSIWLRERNSPQSKPVGAPHAQTGE